MTRWSKLKSRIEERFAPSLELEVRLTVLRATEDQSKKRELGFWVGKKCVWYARAEQEEINFFAVFDEWLSSGADAYWDRFRSAEAGDLETLLLVADRRIGKRRLEKLCKRFEEQPDAEISWLLRQRLTS